MLGKIDRDAAREIRGRTAVELHRAGSKLGPNRPNESIWAKVHYRRLAYAVQVAGRLQRGARQKGSRGQVQIYANVDVKRW